MDQKYLTENTDNLKFILNIVNSSSISVKKKQYKIHSLISFLCLLIMFLFTGNTSAQTALWSTGFETTSTLNYLFDATRGALFGVLTSPANSNSGSNCSYLEEENVP